MTGSTVVTVDRWRSAATNPWYSAQVQYVGSGWRFMEELLLRTDSRLHSLKDISPSRDVLYGRAGTVEEIVTTNLSTEVLADLRATQTLRVQYYARPIDVPPDGIAALRAFLEIE